MSKIKLVNKIIDIDNSRIIYNKPLDDSWQDDWQVMAGEWSVQDGCLVGVERGNKGCVLFFKQRFDGINVMLTCKISTILPATRDVNGIFCAEWDDKTDYLGDYYVCGLNGWYKAGEEIEFTFGSINGHCFMLVDGKLVAEHLDGILKLNKGHIGFSPYCTMLRIRDIVIREISYVNNQQHYNPEF